MSQGGGGSFLINQPTITLAIAFLLPPSSLPLPSTDSCALIGTFLPQRLVTPHLHHPPPSGRAGRRNSKKTISIRGICGAGREREEEEEAALTAAWWFSEHHYCLVGSLVCLWWGCQSSSA